jgi:hypothetical protein
MEPNWNADDTHWQTSTHRIKKGASHRNIGSKSELKTAFEVRRTATSKPFLPMLRCVAPSNRIVHRFSTNVVVLRTFFILQNPLNANNHSVGNG